MNALQENRISLNEDYYRWLIKTNVELRNGTNAQLLTFIPHCMGDHGNGIDSIGAGINYGLQTSGFVKSQQSTLYTLKDNGIIADTLPWAKVEFASRKYPDGSDIFSTIYGMNQIKHP